eukprot:4446971-Prymnesium_polylepis.1
MGHHPSCVPVVSMNFRISEYPPSQHGWLYVPPRTVAAELPGGALVGRPRGDRRSWMSQRW